jgi:hypothetical protein
MPEIDLELVSTADLVAEIQKRFPSCLVVTEGPDKLDTSTETKYHYPSLTSGLGLAHRTIIYLTSKISAGTTNIE